MMLAQFFSIFKTLDAILKRCINYDFGRCRKTPCICSVCESVCAGRLASSRNDGGGGTSRLTSE